MELSPFMSVLANPTSSELSLREDSVQLMYKSKPGRVWLVIAQLISRLER